MEALVTQGPISISVDASKWHSYSSGVFDGCNTMNPDVNHVVVLVGYGVDPQYGPYWTVRNSWGPKYGENGYIRVRRTGGGLYCGVDVTP
jgi:cathepsin L